MIKASEIKELKELREQIVRFDKYNNCEIDEIQVILWYGQSCEYNEGLWLEITLWSDNQYKQAFTLEDDKECEEIEKNEAKLIKEANNIVTKLEKEFQWLKIKYVSKNV